MKYSCNKNGFTLIEIIVVVAIISILTSLTVPNLVSYLGSGRKNSSIFMSYISATAADSIINGKDNYLCIHIGPDPEKKKNEELFENSDSRNSIDVYTLEQGKFALSKTRILKHREFPDDFKIISVIVGDSSPLSSGNIFIPFYSDGNSESFRITVNTRDGLSVIAKSGTSREPVLKDASR